MTDASAPYSREELASLLAFYADSGLDFPVSEEAVDHFAPKPQAEPPKPAEQASLQKRQESPRPHAADTAPVIPDAQAIAMANAAAADAQTLDDLGAAIAAFEGSSLKRSARHTLFESGARNAELMIVLDAPSRDDDDAGHGFQGEMGRLLKAMMAAIGLDSNGGLYAGYCVPWHPPGGQTPSDRHLQICRPFLDRQIALKQPKHMLLLGNTAAQAFLGKDKTIMHLRGGPHEIEIAGHQIQAFATFEPKFLLREQAQKRNAWLDLLSLKAHLNGAN